MTKLCVNYVCCFPPRGVEKVKKLEDISAAPVLADVGIDPDFIHYKQIKTVNEKASSGRRNAPQMVYMPHSPPHILQAYFLRVVFNYSPYELVTPGVHTSLMAV